MSLVVSCEKINKSFNHKNILKDLNFSVKKGEFVSIIGKSGSGKSTFLDLLNGLISPDSGTIKIESNSSTVFQNYNTSLYPHLNVLQNVLLPFNKSDKANNTKGKKYLSLVGLSEHLKKMPTELSGGMQQRVALARALAQEPHILFLDEPLGSIDSFTRNILLNEIQEIHQKMNLTIVMVTHNIDEAIFLSSKVYYLDISEKKFSSTFKIDIPYPRSLVETITSEKFNQYKRDLLELYK